jgi:hypothetical protein
MDRSHRSSEKEMRREKKREGRKERNKKEGRRKKGKKERRKEGKKEERERRKGNPPLTLQNRTPTTRTACQQHELNGQHRPSTRRWISLLQTPIRRR